MNGYSILIFFHVLGAVGMFVAWGVEAANVRRLHYAIAADETKSVLQLLRKQRLMGSAVMLTVIVTGFWMMIDRWGQQPWMTAAIIALALIIIAGAVLTRRGMNDLKTAVGDNGEPPAGLPVKTTALMASLRLRFALGAGILALMTIKPDALVSIIIMAVSLTTGIIFVAFAYREKEPQRPGLRIVDLLMR